MDDKCKLLISYLDDILDSCADESIEKAFFEHIEVCEKCRTKYEISVKIRDILKSTAPKSDDELQSEVISRLNGLKPVYLKAESEAEKKKFSRNMKILISGIVVCIVAVVVLGIIFIPKLISSIVVERPGTEEQGYGEKKVISLSDNASYINSNFFRILSVPENMMRLTAYSSDDVCSILRVYESDFVGSGYNCIIFVIADDVDCINRSLSVKYISSSEKNGISLYTIKSSYADFSANFSDIKEELVVNGDHTSDTALIVLRTK